MLNIFGKNTAQNLLILHRNNDFNFFYAKQITEP